MEVVIVFSIIAICLFVAAFITRRRFGLLGLALAAGSILSAIWAREAGYIASIFGVRQTAFSTAVILALMILLPAVVLLFHGTTYKKMIGRLVGASLFTALAFAFLIVPLGRILTLSGMGADVYDAIYAQRSNIIGIGLIIAVVDLFLTKPAPNFPEKRHKH
jgi:hypothetical protein